MATDNYKFPQLIGSKELPYLGYLSSKDKTNVDIRSLIRGSMNVYKKRSGNIANRPGRKLRGEIDATDAGVVSAFVFNNLQGTALPLRVANNKLQVESDIADGSTLVWYDLHEAVTLQNPAVTLTRFVFDTWWEGEEQAAKLLMVRGDSNVLHWSGGMALFDSVTPVLGSVDPATFIISNTGSGYVVGDILTLVGGNSDATVYVATVSAGAITSGYFLTALGSGYMAGILATTGGSGTGATFTVTTTTTYNLTKQGTDTWAQIGFNTFFLGKSAVHTGTYSGLYYYKKLIVNGVEYTYVSGEDTTTLKGIPSNVVTSSGDVIIQSVYVESLVTEIPDDDFVADFMSVLNNQVLYGSYISRVIHISADQTTGQGTTSSTSGSPSTSNVKLGFTNLVNNPATSLVIGDPDYIVLDNVANGMVSKNGSMYVSSGSSDWFEITPNSIPNVGVPLYHGINTGLTAYVITKVIKLPGSGLSGLLAHEFGGTRGNDVIYVSKDGQLRTIALTNNAFAVRFPILSQSVYDELANEDFTGGALATLNDFTYITAPLSGRHWIYEIRDEIDVSGNTIAERVWYAPFVEGISRFVEIDGVTYGHSNSNPQIYQIWDTNQWFDDDSSGEDIGYTSAARFAYNQVGKRALYNNFGKIYFEGFLQTGTELLGHIYYDYQGSTTIKNVIINLPNENPDEDNAAILFAGDPTTTIGNSTIGENPLGIPLVQEQNEQDALPKFRSITDVSDVDAFEYSVEVYSLNAGDRWELVCFGTNAEESDRYPTNLNK